jgi:hypothetical protein
MPCAQARTALPDHGCGFHKKCKIRLSGLQSRSVKETQEKLLENTMTRFTGMLLIGFAILLYLLSAVTFVDYLYSLTIRDTVTAVENAFGTLVILIFMLVMAKFSRAKGKSLMFADQGSHKNNPVSGEATDPAFDPGQSAASEEAEK